MFTSYAQYYKSCKVFQYIGLDSLHKELVAESYYNKKGQLILYCDYMGYKNCMSCGREGGSHFNEYKDSLLMLTRSFNENTGDSIKTVFYYNILWQKIEEEYFDYRRRQKKDSKKGLGQPGGCVVFDSDFEKDRTWQKMGEIIFQYDSNGNKITSDDLRSGIDIEGGSHKWTYDNNHRIIIDSVFGFSYGHSLEAIDLYTYDQNGYQYTRTWYFNGIPRPLDGDYGLYDPHTTVYKQNERGQIIDEMTPASKAFMGGRTITFYNFSGDIVKQIQFNSGEPEITHIYSYE